MIKSIIALFTSILCAFSSATGIFSQQVKTVNTLTKVEDGFYIMNYTYDYDVDRMLKRGIGNTVELVLYGVSSLLSDAGKSGCTTFNSVTKSGDYLLSRNFDYMDAPYMLIRTTPKNGYASISSVSLEFLGYSLDGLLPSKDITAALTLLAPYAPLDGINEKGLSIGVLELEVSPTKQMTLKQDLTTTTMIRAVLDKAATVDEAIKIFNTYDMNDMLFGEAAYHYQIADANGDTCVIEYVNGKVNVLRPEKVKGNAVDYMAATNFYLTKGVKDPDALGHDRYDKAMAALRKTKGVTSEKQAMNILKSVSVKDEDMNGYICSTLWSVVFNMSKGRVNVVHYLNYGKVYTFSVYKPLSV